MVVNAQFNPFTYQEMLHPVLMATQEHNAMLDQYGDLSTKASVWEGMLDKERDADVYGKYKEYSDELNRISDSIASEGLNPQSRKLLMKMRSRYSSDITPIETAYNKRNEFINKLIDANLRDQTAIFNRDFSNISLSEMMKNPSLSFLTISGQELTKLVAQLAKALSNEIFENPRKFKGILESAFGPQYYETMIRNGFTPEQVQQAIMKDPQAKSILTDIVDNVIASSGIDQFGEAAIQRGREFANQGLFSAIGGQKFDTLDNKMFNANLLLAMKKKELEAEAAEAPRNNMVDIIDDVSYVHDPEIKGLEGAINDIKNLHTVLDDGTSKSRSMKVQLDAVNKHKLNKILKQYGTTDPAQLQKILDEKITKTAQNNKVYNLRMTDKTMVTNSIKDRVSATAKSGSGEIRGIEVIKSNGETKTIKASQFNDLMSGDYSIGVNGKGETIISGYVGDDKEYVKVKVDDAYISSARYKEDKKAMLKFNLEGKYAEANDAGMAAIAALYNDNTDVALAQSKSAQPGKIGG